MADGNDKRVLPGIAHYHGDMVRGLLVVAAVLVVVLPLIGATLGTGLLIAIALALVVCAGLVNPRSRGILVGAALLSAFSAALFSIEAARAYEEGALLPAAVQTGIALCSLFALYFSVKSARAMAMHMLGKRAVPHEFDEA